MSGLLQIWGRNYAFTRSCTCGSSISISDESHRVIRHSKSLKLKSRRGAPLRPMYGGRHMVTMLPGGGLGPEMMARVREMFRYIRAPIDFEIMKTDTQENVLQAITSVRRNGCCIVGNMQTIADPEDNIFHCPNIALRKKLDLYSCLNVCKSYTNVKAKYDDLNIIVIRENTEGEYSMLEHSPRRDIVECMKIGTRANCERIARWTYLYAMKNDRKKVTIVHKANIMKQTDGLFLHTCRRVGLQFPEIITNDMIVDNCSMQMVSNPEQFDVLLCANLYGLIMCSIVCGLIGGDGLISGCNYGDYYAAFEIATRTVGTEDNRENNNPVAMLNASVDLLYYLRYPKHADVIDKAIKKTIEVDKVLTPDIGGSATVDEVIAKIKDNTLLFMDDYNKESAHDTCEVTPQCCIE